MPGRIVAAGPSLPHFCTPPQLWTMPSPLPVHTPSVVGELFDPGLIEWTSIGTVWQCDCGDAWIVEWVNDARNVGFVEAAHTAWRRETRRERRRRLRGVR